MACEMPAHGLSMGHVICLGFEMNRCGHVLPLVVEVTP